MHYKNEKVDQAILCTTGFMYDFMMFMTDELQLSEQRMRDLVHMQVGPRSKSLDNA